MASFCILLYLKIDPVCIQFKCWIGFWFCVEFWEDYLGKMFKTLYHVSKFIDCKLNSDLEANLLEERLRAGTCSHQDIPWSPGLMTQTFILRTESWVCPHTTLTQVTQPNQIYHLWSKPIPNRNIGTDVGLRRSSPLLFHFWHSAPGLVH